MSAPNTTVTVDPRRSCPAVQVGPDDPDLQPGEHCHTTPGKARRYAGDMLMFACPGCGLSGAITVGHPKPAEQPSWDVVAGTLDDVTTLSLVPSIYCTGCCNWHGTLTNGQFVSV